MDKRMVAFILTGSLIADVVLEIMHIPVPSILMLLSGFCARHIVGDNNDSLSTPTQPIKSNTVAAIAPTMPVVALFIAICLFFVSCPAQAKETVINNTQINPTAIVVANPNLFGAMADAPKLVRIYGDWYLGAEGGKDLAYTNTSKGWFAYGKVTYNGTVLNLFGKKEED